MSVKLLDNQTVNAAGSWVSAGLGGLATVERRIEVEVGSDLSGGPITIEILGAGLSVGKPTGISFAADTDAPELLMVSPGDQVRAVPTGTSTGRTVVMS